MTAPVFYLEFDPARGYHVVADDNGVARSLVFGYIGEYFPDVEWLTSIGGFALTRPLDHERQRITFSRSRLPYAHPETTR
jgi:hypothetical protein